VTNSICPECGAPLPAGRACLDHFHALLVLEGTFPGAPGSILHFYAVACYNLQHLDSVGLTAEALEGLRRTSPTLWTARHQSWSYAGARATRRWTGTAALGR
jgi:hypothetical protein